MTDAVLWGAAFLVSLGALVKGADWFLTAAERVGLDLGLSPFIIGVTLLGAGTSLPELVAGITSVLVGNSQIAVGTAVGSNITNLLLILGTAALIGRGLLVSYDLIRVDLPFLFGSALMLALFSLDGEIDRIEGVLSLGGVAVYLAYTISTQEDPATAIGVAAADIVEAGPPGRGRTWLALAGGAVLLQVGAYYAVESVIHLSELLGVATSVLAASLVAIGTSLPELSVSVRSAQAGRPELAVGNVIGSNVFNALGVVGGASLFGTLVVSAPILTLAIPAMLGATVLAFFVLQEREMTRWDGWLLLILFAGFTLQLYRV